MAKKRRGRDMFFSIVGMVLGHEKLFLFSNIFFPFVKFLKEMLVW